MTENDPKFTAFKNELREYLLSNCREFLELNPDHPSLRCLTDDTEWGKKFSSIWMMFSPEERAVLLETINGLPESLLPKLARAVVAGGAYKRRMEEALAAAEAIKRH